MTLSDPQPGLRISKIYTATEPDKFRGLWLVTSSASHGVITTAWLWELAENAADEDDTQSL